jgi:hypothetical protein
MEFHFSSNTTTCHAVPFSRISKFCEDSFFSQMQFGFDQINIQSQSRPNNIFQQLAASPIQGYEANPLEVRECVNGMNHAIVS